MSLHHFSLKIALAILIASTMSLNASAQVSDLTFSRPATGDSMVSEIEFGFNVPADVDVQLDQLGAVTALFQNNDTFGQDFGIDVSGPVDSIGAVTIGQMLTAGTDFGSTSLLVSDFVAPGENFYLGFSSGADIGYFNIAWEPGTNSNIVYSEGQFATSGASLIVAVPEPASAIVVVTLGMAALIRRRRA